MSCKISYIQNTTLDNLEKERLENIHVQLFAKAKDSKAFRNFDGKLYTLKNDYNKATEFIAQINNEVKAPVAKIIRGNVGQPFLSVNVLPLAQKQGELFLQTPNIPSVETSPAVVKLSKDLLTKIGVDYQAVKDISVNGVKLQANGVANITQGIVQVIQGKESEALPEEAIHFAVEILEQKNPKLFNKLLKEINSFKVYSETVAAYSNNTNYQTKDGKPDIRKIKKEAIAKQLVNTIINKMEGSAESYPLTAKTQSWWSEILEFFRNIFISSGFDQASMDVISGKFEGTIEDARNNSSDNNNIYLQQESSKFTAKEIIDAFKTVEKPNERKFNKPTNLPKGFRLVYGTRDTDRFNQSETIDLTGGGDRKSISGSNSNSVSYYKGLFGKSFKELLQSGQKGDLEASKRYTNLRILQSLNDNKLLNDLSRKLGISEIRIVNETNNSSPIFIGKDGFMYINEDKLLEDFTSLYNQGANLDELSDLVVFEELIHKVVREIIPFEDLKEAYYEMKPFKASVDSFYTDSPITSVENIDPYISINEMIRMKVQKDLAGKSTEDVINKIVTKVWDFLMGLFKTKLVKSNSITTKVKDYITNVREIDTITPLSISDLGVSGVNPSQNSLYDKLKGVAAGVEKRGEEGYFVDGKKVPRRVSELVQDWYKRRLGDKSLTNTEYDNAVNDLKAEKGTKGHSDLEHAFEVYVDENGFLRQEVLNDDNYVSQLNPENNAMYNILKDNLRERLQSFPIGTRFISEQIVYDQKRGLAGTVDFLAITPDGKVSILDWKFMDLNTEKYTDIPWYKINAWNQQMEQYKLMLEKVYGVKPQDFQQTRMIPIKATYILGDRKKNILPHLVGVKIGDVNVKNITEDFLLPVGLETEKTGNRKIDNLIEKLNAVYKNFSDKKVLPSEKQSKAEQLNSLFTTIRQLQIKGNLRPLLYQAKVLNKQIQSTIIKFNDNWKGKSSNSFTQSEISDFAEEIETAQNAIAHYTTLDTDLKFLFSGELTEEDEKLKKELRDVVDDARDLQSSMNEIGGDFVNEFVAGSEAVNNILSPEKVIKGLTRWFSSTATLQMKSVEVLYKKANRAFTYASMDTVDETKKLQNIKKEYDEWASKKGLTQKNYFDFIKKKNSNTLIDEFQSEFYKDLKNKIKENDIKWLKSNIDVENYKNHLEDLLKTEIQRIKDKPRVGSEEEIDTEITREISKAKKLYNINAVDSPGWYLTNEIKKFPVRDKWETKEWKELHLKENSPALAFYNYIKERNEYYQSIGYITKGEARTFLPFVRKGLMEKLITSGFKEITIGEQALRSISIDEGDVGYGKTDPLTGRLIDSIPIYFTKEIDGAISEDLFRNMALYNEMAIRYKHLSDIEAQVRALINVERSKKAIATSMFGKTVYKDGRLEYTPDNNDNTKLLEDMVKGIIYGQRYIQSETFDQVLGTIGGFGKNINEKLGVKIFPEDLEGRQLSVNKALTQLNTTFQLNALGLNPLSALSNLMGGTFQSTINAGTYFTKSDFMASEMWILANKMTGKDQKKMIGALEYFLPLTDSYNKELAKTLSLNKLSQENIQEFLMILMRKSDWFVQTANFYAFLNNSVVQDGQVLNAREYLRTQPEYQNMLSGNSNERKIKRDNFEKDVKKLIEEKGVLKVGKIENDQFVIPGVERKSDSVITLRRKVQQVSKDALGNLSEDDLRVINMNIYGKSFMLFKNWIPRPVDVRIGNLKYNSASDAYEWGRMRMVFRLLTTDLAKSIDSLKNSLAGDGSKWSQQMSDLFQKKKDEYEEETGKTLEMTESEFMNLMNKNVKSQLVDTLFMLSLFSMVLGLKALAPDDEEDERVKNSFRFMLRATDKIKDELWFFYDPTSLTSLVSTGVFPSIAYLNNLKKLVTNFGKETFAITTGDEELEDKNYVIKYLMKSFPVSNQASQMMPMFYPSIAKDLGIRLSSESRISR